MNFCMIVTILGMILIRPVSCNLPSIDKYIEKETKPAGQEGMLNCTVSDKGTNKVIWQKLSVTGGKNEAISSDTNILTLNPEDTTRQLKYRVVITQVTDSKAVYTLAIRALQDYDSGTYECYLLIFGDDPATYPRAMGELVVQLPPAIQDSIITTFVQVAVGGDALLRCRADGVPPPRISWSRPSGLPLPNGATVFFGEDMIVTNATSADRGAYRCKADNDVKPPAIQDVTLEVFYPPTMTPFRTYVGQAPGRNYEIRLSCLVSGNPEPVATWIRTEGLKLTELQDSEKYRIDKLLWLPGTNMKIGDYWHELIIINVGDGDAGNYRCEASNVYGSSWAEINVFMTTTCQTWKCWGLMQVMSSSPHLYISMTTLIGTIVMATIQNLR